MRILLATSLLPLFTIVAGAQINAGPFAIVDENGTLILTDTPLYVNGLR